MLEIDQYADLFYAAGGRDLTVFEKVYPHILDGPDALADWTSGTALVLYVERLPESLRQLFMQTYRTRLREIYSPGAVLWLPANSVCGCAPVISTPPR